MIMTIIISFICYVSFYVLGRWHEHGYLKRNKWTSVHDKLPVIHENTLILLKQEDGYVVCVYSNEKHPIQEQIKIREKCWDTKITHWMLVD